jgi:hypothetical protein
LYEPLFGCAAMASLDLLGSTRTEVANKLDACIDPVLELFNKDRDHDRCRVGIDGEQWHICVIRRALKNARSASYFKKQVVSQHGGCLSLLHSGSFLIDGHLNRSYLCPGGQRVFQPGHEEDDRSEDSWRHCIAVKDGRLYSSGLPDCGLPVSNLWLDKEGRPDQERSYLRRFLRVYRVEHSE